MTPYQSIWENFRFLVVEVLKQVEGTFDNLNHPTNEKIDAIHIRDNYIDNLKSIIERKCFFVAHSCEKDDKTIDQLIALRTIAANLERIADHSVNIAKQTRHFQDRDFIHNYNFEIFFEEILAALKLVDEAVSRNDVTLGLRICRAEFQLDQLFARVFQTILQDLKLGSQIGNLITTLFIFRYLERMGDCLLNIGEAILSAHIGERLKIRQYQALEESLAAAAKAEIPLGELEYEAMQETRSGARVGKVGSLTPIANDTHGVIFKEGAVSKIMVEKQNLERWGKLRPGLIPRVFDYQEYGNNASLLVEYLPGYNFQELVLNYSDRTAEEALGHIANTIFGIWRETRYDKSLNAGYISQLDSRLKDIIRIHPSFRMEAGSIGGVKFYPLKELLEQSAVLEEKLPVGFTTLIHGDFNIDNILYEPASKAVHFVDLHRSRESDYVQDISVFLVSNVRLPVYEADIRRRLNRLALSFLARAREFAASQKDELFEARLALGLSRSLATSTRFVLKADFAQNMFLRAIYLLEKLAAHQGKPYEDFRLADEVVEF